MFDTSPEVAVRIEAIARRLREIDLSPERLTAEAVHAGVVRDVYAELWDVKPFRTFLPERHGGSGAPAAEVLDLLGAIAFESLPMALAVGLTAALFLLPVATHAEGARAEEALARFAGDDVVLGGMMMTEPGCGTDLFATRTRVEPHGPNVRIRGVKHWQGLTGHADAWLVFGRNDTERRSRSLGFHLAPADSGFAVEEYYRAHGLAPIPYGRTGIDVEVPASNRIGGDEPYTAVVGGILCGSRLSFSGVAHGFLRRVREETERHVGERSVFRRRLADYDSVRARLEQVVYGECVARALCLHVVDASPRISSAKTPLFPEAAMVKALATDFMSEAANHLAVLRGGEGYRADQAGFGGVIHAHPFRVFEGPNDVLF
ncbi:MAG: acyl-CoA dehydrogenase family protein, partial [Planctomycetota bacterium]